MMATAKEREQIALGASGNVFGTFQEEAVVAAEAGLDPDAEMPEPEVVEEVIPEPEVVTEPPKAAAKKTTKKATTKDS